MSELYPIGWYDNDSYGDEEGTLSRFIELIEHVDRTGGMVEICISHQKAEFKIDYTVYTGDHDNPSILRVWLGEVLVLWQENGNSKEMALRGLDAVFQLMEVLDNFGKDYDETRITMRIF